VLQGLQPLIERRQEVMDGVGAEGLDAATERKVAVDLFNHTWTLLDKADRTREEDDEMHGMSRSAGSRVAARRLRRSPV
jgi:hypothetical protein